MNKRKRNVFIRTGLKLDNYGLKGTNSGDTRNNSMLTGGLDSLAMPTNLPLGSSYLPGSSGTESGPSHVTQHITPKSVNGFPFREMLDVGDQVFYFMTGGQVQKTDAYLMNFPSLQYFLRVSYILGEKYVKNIFKDMKKNGTKYGIKNLNSEDPFENINIDALKLFARHKQIVPVFDINRTKKIVKNSPDFFLSELKSNLDLLTKSLGRSSGTNGLRSAVGNSYASVVKNYVSELEDDIDFSSFNGTNARDNIQEFKYQSHLDKLNFINEIFNDLFSSWDVDIASQKFAYAGVIINDLKHTVSHHGKRNFKGFNTDVYDSTMPTSQYTKKLKTSRLYSTGNSRHVVVANQGIAETHNVIGNVFEGGKIKVHFGKHYDESLQRYTYIEPFQTCRNSYDDIELYHYDIYDSSNSIKGNNSDLHFKNMILDEGYSYPIGTVFQSRFTGTRNRSRNNMKKNTKKSVYGNKTRGKGTQLTMAGMVAEYRKTPSMFVRVNEL